ncbi:protamine-like protein 99C [Drosophila eugracilis]|uniref:protamine-like protein 99C n=1 Tax=Drosophila eugracilis TaxID=29029 RepID=UPI001BDAF35C|nr:protamine-like protein 99C [Drosophila eugracilis]XP_017067955.2 protamine-like protein 99C [Drosophila eugracilis]
MTDEVKESKSMSNGSWATNGFLNYLCDFRRQNENLSWLELAKEGAKSWERISEEERNYYRNMSGNKVGIIAMSMDAKQSEVINGICNNPMVTERAIGSVSCMKPKKSRARPRKNAACAKPKRMTRPRPKKSACARPKKSACGNSKCSKPGPITNNGYLNFVRAFRKKHCDLKPQELIMQAAKAWSRLPEERKDHYRRMACKITQSERHKRRRICNRC